MSKVEKRAYADGIADAREGNNHLGRRSMLRLVRPSAYLPGGAARDVRYMKAYSEGNEDGRRTYQVVSTSQDQSTRSPNMRPTNYGYQIELLDALDGFLRKLQERLDGSASLYANLAEELHEAGMMDETHRRFVARQMETVARLKQLVEHIEVNDRPAIRRAKARAEEGRDGD